LVAARLRGSQGSLALRREKESMALIDEGLTIKNIRERTSYIRAAVRARFLQKLHE
jgi:hypothetical protein